MPYQVKTNLYTNFVASLFTDICSYRMPHNRNTSLIYKLTDLITRHIDSAVLSDCATLVMSTPKRHNSSLKPHNTFTSYMKPYNRL
jgi:hypothetical protein